MDTLHLEDCRFEAGDTTSVASIPRSGVLAGTTMQYGPGGFKLPREGVAIAVVFGHDTLGHIVLIPDDRVGSSHDTRQAAVALADLYAVALHAHNVGQRS